MVEKRSKSPEPEADSKQNFFTKIEARFSWGNYVSLGLDSEFEKLPQAVKRRYVALDTLQAETFAFNKAELDSTHDLLAVYKPNSAFYEANGLQGQAALLETVTYTKEHYPDLPVILDAKRGDIGNTNRMYARAVFDQYQADAVTLHPYLGTSVLNQSGERQIQDLAPFLERKDKGIFVLCRTSNPAAGELQDLPVDITKLSNSYKERFGNLEELREITEKDVVPLYQIVAYKASRHWNVNGNCALVVGATYPEELSDVRKIVGDNMLILLPGVGAQEGDLEAAVRAGRNSQGNGIIINSARQLIFASPGKDFAEATRRATEELRYKINQAIQAIKK